MKIKVDLIQTVEIDDYVTAIKFVNEAGSSVVVSIDDIKQIHPITKRLFTDCSAYMGKGGER